MSEMILKIDALKNIINDIERDIDSMEDETLRKEEFYMEIPNISKQINNQLEVWKELELSEQLLKLVDEILITYNERLNDLFNSYLTDLVEKYNRIHNVLLELKNETKRVKYLSLIKEKNVVLVGGNGAGKSSFASYLKESFSNNIIVIPAQKFLVLDLNITNLHLMDKEKVNTIQQDNYIQRGKIVDDSNDKYAGRKYTSDLSELFSKFITVLVNEQIAVEHKIINNTNSQSELKDEKDKTILFKLNSLWHNLIPDIEFDIDTTHRTLIPIKNDQEYSINAMSDGEKAMLYYISYVLLAESDSFIVVDEPETFLNASNFNRLWDTLEAFRPDCKFIYISHVVDFIVSRSNTDLLWCKSFSYPDDWDIEVIDTESTLSEEFPRELLSELLGARKPILFCEGEKSSLDYSIYSSIFKNEVIVYPVGGHRQVIQYTRSYNNLSAIFNGNTAVGLIDSDLMGEAQIQKYKNDNIFTLKFNEIENLFFTEEVMIDVLRHFTTVDEMKGIINEFKENVFQAISNRIETISFEKSKKYVDTKLSNYRINNSSNTEDIVKEVTEWFGQLNIVGKSIEFQDELKEYIREKDYEEVLKICPFKEDISKDIANRYLDSDFLDKATNRIKHNEVLAETIKNKYFDEVTLG